MWHPATGSAIIPDDHLRSFGVGASTAMGAGHLGLGAYHGVKANQINRDLRDRRKATRVDAYFDQGRSAAGNHPITN